MALQVGHWKDDLVPRELRALRSSAGGANYDGAIEWQINLQIAVQAQKLLRAQGVRVQLLPATVTPSYRAAAFISVHADGNDDRTVSGFKVAPSRVDRSGQAAALSISLASSYARRTGLARSPAITADMTDYYAFDRRRFRHAIDPTTPGVVIETGFLSSDNDRQIIISRPLLAAQGVASGVMDFLCQRRSTLVSVSCQRPSPQ